METHIFVYVTITRAIYTSYIIIMRVSEITSLVPIDNVAPISISISSSPVYVENTVTLTCVMDDLGNPLPRSYTWYLNGGNVSVTNTTTTQIEVTSVTQEGSYTCSDTNFPYRHPPVTSDQSPSSQLVIYGILSKYTCNSWNL